MHKFNRMYALGAVLSALAVGIANAAPMGSAFTYQGRLMFEGQPASGIFECQFNLYDAMNGGNLIASIPMNGIEPQPEDNGLFTTWLDFGPGAFNGEARWLEVSVRPENDFVIPFTTLSPRQELKPAPYAGYAALAGGFAVPMAITQPDNDEALLKLVNTGAAAAIWAEGTTGPGLLAVNNSPGGTALFAANMGTGPVATFLGGNVGIGTQTPGSKLTVNGMIETKQGGIKFPDSTIQMSAAQDQVWHVNDSDIFYQEGNVGIGVSTPEQLLHLKRPLSPLAIRFDSSRYLAVPPESDEEGPGIAQQLGTGGASWVTHVNSLNVDGSFATAVLSSSATGPDTLSTGTLHLKNFGFNIPADATITGIKVSGEGYFTSWCPSCTLWEDGSGGPVVDAEIRLMRNGVATMTRTSGLDEGGSSIFSNGSNGDKWGETWTPALINSPDFAVRISAKLELWTICGFLFDWYDCLCTDCDGSANVFLDGLTVTVYYQPVPEEPSPVDWSIGVPGNRAALVIAPNADMTVPQQDDWYDGGIVIDHYAGNVGIGIVPQATPVGMKLQVDGQIQCDSVWETSSRRFKNNVQTLGHALDTLSQLRGVSYEWDDKHGGGRDIGFVAEEVGAVLPEIVQYEADGENAVGMKYDRIGALAVEAIKELHGQIKRDAAVAAEQKARIEHLEAELKAIKQLLNKDVAKRG